MEIERLVAALVRRWYVVVAFGFVGALIGQIAEAQRSDDYIATATIEVAPDRDIYGSETVLNRLVVNELGTIASLSMRESVVESLGADGQGLDPIDDLSAQQVTDTELINVSVSAPNEATAIVAANSWASSYVEFVRTRERNELESLVDRLDADLATARADRLALDADLRESVVVRRNSTVSTYNETVLRDPELWDGIVKLDQEIELLVRQRATAELVLLSILDSRVVSAAVGPIEPVRDGNGLGPFEGLIIALAASVAAIAMDAYGRISQRTTQEITGSAWPTSIRLARRRFVLPWHKRKIQRDISAVGTQILTQLPDTRLQVISFAGVDRERTEDMKAALSQDLQARGYSVSLMGDQHAAIQSRTVDGMLDLLHASDSVVFADLGDLQSKRFSGRIMTVVTIDEHRDSEELVARQISDSVEISDSVLTVVAR